jgi:hypothetical protein
MSLRKVLIASLFLIPVAVLVATSRPGPARAAHPAAVRARAAQPAAGKANLKQYLHGLGYKRRGGVNKGVGDKDDSFPHFTSSFTVNGTTYPFTMIGKDPKTGHSSTIQSIIIPLRLNFTGLGPDGSSTLTFDPGTAVTSMVGSPLYQAAEFPNGTGQFCDQMQRAAFWNLMDKQHRWHVYMDQPNVAPTIDVTVTPDIGTLTDPFGTGNYLGNVPIDWMDSLARTTLSQLNLGAGVLPIFVTSGVTADALGYHTAYAQPGSTPLVQTYIYTSWLDPSLVPPIFADVSTFNHELAEWMNDPYTNNTVPDWMYPPSSDPSTVCSENTYLEVGDPQGNGPTYADFPTAEIVVNGVTYHLQQLVLWQWFTDQVPSSALGGWYTFPIPASLNQPAVYCPQ